MPIELQTALIAAVVALLTGGISGYLTWNQIQRERVKWLTELKTAYATELYEVRLQTYPTIMKTFQPLSQKAPKILKPEHCSEIVQEINNWIYSAGGLSADKSTRGAIIGLRNALFAWKDGPRPVEITEWRDVSMFLLRRDLDVYGIEAPEEVQDRSSLLEKLKREVGMIG